MKCEDHSLIAVFIFLIFKHLRWKPTVSWSERGTRRLNGPSVAIHTHAEVLRQKSADITSDPHMPGSRWHTHTRLKLGIIDEGRIRCLRGTASDNGLDKQHQPVKVLRETTSLMAREDLWCDNPRVCIVSVHVYSRSSGHFQVQSRGGTYWLWGVFRSLAVELDLWLLLVHTRIPSGGSPLFQSSGSPRPVLWLNPGDELKKNRIDLLDTRHV